MIITAVAPMSGRSASAPCAAVAAMEATNERALQIVCSEWEGCFNTNAKSTAQLEDQSNDLIQKLLQRQVLQVLLVHCSGPLRASYVNGLHIFNTAGLERS